MRHISYSELKNWVTCPFYHKLTYIDKIKVFAGNEYTAFGTALHETCEKTMLNETKDPAGFFLEAFARQIEAISDVDMNQKLITSMEEQGYTLAPLAIPALEEYFGEGFTIVSLEEELYETISECKDIDYNFKGFIDLVVKTPDEKYHIIDWKTCSWGWDSRRKSDRMTTYQLTLYKHFWAKKRGINVEDIETHFALLKRTAKSNRVELFRITSGKRKVDNAINLLTKAVYNIDKSNFIKNKTSCMSRFGPCDFYKTEHCP